MTDLLGHIAVKFSGIRGGKIADDNTNGPRDLSKWREENDGRDKELDRNNEI